MYSLVLKFARYQGDQYAARSPPHERRTAQTPKIVIVPHYILDDANLVGDVKRIVVCRQAHVRLLQAVGPARSNRQPSESEACLPAAIIRGAWHSMAGQAQPARPTSSPHATLSRTSTADAPAAGVGASSAAPLGSTTDNAIQPSRQLGSHQSPPPPPCHCTASA